MYHGQGTTFLERLEIIERAAAGQTDREIATALGYSGWTVRKWRRRAQRQDRTALRTRLGRPATGPLSTIDPTLQQTIRHLRQTHAGWGPNNHLSHLARGPAVGATAPTQSRPCGGFLEICRIHAPLSPSQRVARTSVPTSDHAASSMGIGCARRYAG